MSEQSIGSGASAPSAHGGPSWTFQGRIAWAEDLLKQIEFELIEAGRLISTPDVLDALHDGKIAACRVEEALERAANCFADAAVQSPVSPQELHGPIEVVFRDGRRETFRAYSFIDCGEPALIHDNQKHPYTDYEMPVCPDCAALEKPARGCKACFALFPAVLYVTERGGDLAPLFWRDIQQITIQEIRNVQEIHPVAPTQEQTT